MQHTTDAVEEEKHTERLSKKRVVVVVVVLLLGYLRERERVNRRKKETKSTES